MSSAESNISTLDSDLSEAQNKQKELNTSLADLKSSFSMYSKEEDLVNREQNSSINTLHSRIDQNKEEMNNSIHVIGRQIGEVEDNMQGNFSEVNSTMHQFNGTQRQVDGSQNRSIDTLEKEINKTNEANSELTDANKTQALQIKDVVSDQASLSDKLAEFKKS